ncbi:MAG TPA: endonuclease MutS2 [Bacillota bacterium]|nr:endonuclease MutS2 [Bacillota bacterium]
MDERSVRVLEFHKIKDRLKALAATNLGKELADSLRPVTDLHEVRRRQKETTEGRAILSAGRDVSLGGVRDIRSFVERAAIGGTLTPEELLDVSSTLGAAMRLRKFITGLGGEFAILREYAEGITPQPGIVKEIERCIDEYGNVVDHASCELARIRSQIRAVNNRIREKLDSIIKSEQSVRYLQEPIITLRSGRFVVPVKQEARTSVPGIVHDRSQSGQTLFIEPMPIVDLNNELTQLAGKEKEEVERILQKLSFAVSGASVEILDTVSILGAIDFALAKGRLSLDMKAQEPDVDNKGYLRIRQGRHPLLSGDVVPIDVELGKDFRTLVVTGPNTGGKTVTLKTIGLFALMTLAGLHIPALSGTKVPVFSQVFADIGDEQSIEQSLSTFSSHMTHIVKIMEQADSSSLVLLDELGAGTDPREGAALGVAILKYLHERGASTVVTTHLSELKTFAYEYEGAENASCEFDVETLEPTYRLIMGLPGGSCALAVASRLGLPEEVINTACNYLGEDRIQVDSIIAEMKRTMEELEAEKEEAEKAREEQQRLRQRQEIEVKQIEEARLEILRKAKTEADTMLAQAKADIAAIIKELRKSSQLQMSAIDDEARKAREALKEVSERGRPIEEELSGQDIARGEIDSVRPLNPDEIEVGAEVFVGKLGQVGQINWVSGEGDDVEVQVGGLKVLVSRKDLYVPEGEDCRKKPSYTGQVYLSPITREKASAVSMELDVRGHTVEEAIADVDKYLDDVCLAGLKRVRIIHGKGTGALKQAVRKFLKEHPHVDEALPGGLSEGGDGATVVLVRGR